VNKDKDEVMIGHIYVFLSPSGKRYVGQTIRTIEERIGQHWGDVKRGCSLPIHNAMRSYGKESIKIEHIFTIRCTQEYLDLMEDRAIVKWNTLVPNGYNLTRGGRGGAKPPRTEETKAKISAARMGQVSPMAGKCHSEETKTKISATCKITRANKPGAFTGKRHSEETKARISATAKRVRAITKTKLSHSDCNRRGD